MTSASVIQAYIGARRNTIIGEGHRMIYACVTSRGISKRGLMVHKGREGGDIGLQVTRDFSQGQKETGTPPVACPADSRMHAFCGEKDK